MKELKINEDLTIKYKSGLTEADYLTLVSLSVEAYNIGIKGQIDNVGVIPYNPIKAYQSFYRILLSIGIEDYDDSNYDYFFSLGIHKILLDEIINAKDAFDMLNYIMSSSNDVSNVIKNFLDNLLEKIDSKLLDSGDLEKLLKKLPKDFSKIFSGYQQMIKPSKNNNEEK